MPQAQINKPHILYAIQGTGNGHIARAITLIPEIRKYASVDVLISGIQADLDLPFDVKYRLKGLSFIFGKRGGVDFWKMFRKVSLFNFSREIRRLDLSEYDFVVNDFEPVSAWAAKRQQVPCVGFSHQAGVNQPEAPKPGKGGRFGKWILNNYAPSWFEFGFHFRPYNENTFTPIIREEVRSIKPSNKKHFTVYLPAYDDKIILEVLKPFGNYNWEIFSKHTKAEKVVGNTVIKPIQNQAFVNSIASSDGVICGAGFETPAEVIYFQKKLIVIPMSHQFEQHCNALAAKQLGVKVLNGLNKNTVAAIKAWIEFGTPVTVNFADNKTRAVQRMLSHTNEKIFQNKFTFAFK